MTNIEFALKSRFEGQESLNSLLSGKYAFRETEARVMYAHRLTEGEKPVPETLSVTLDGKGMPLTATIRRPGSEFELTFERGQESETWLATPAGNLHVLIRTKRLEGMFAASRFELHVQYEMVLGGESQGTTRISYISKVK